MWEQQSKGEGQFSSFLLDLIPSISHLLQQKERWNCMRMDLPINELMKYL